MKKVLIVEDDINLGTTLAGTLEIKNLQVRYSDGNDDVLDTFSQFKPDIILMDVLLPHNQNGFEIAERIRRRKNHVPIIFITSLEGADAMKKAFSFDNSDYINKPFRMQEVLLRMNNLLSKQYRFNLTDNFFQIGETMFFPEEQLLRRGTKRIHLNKYQTLVLVVLCNSQDTFLSRSEIIQEVWRVDDCRLKENSLNNVLSGLRKYFTDDPRVEISSVMKLGVKLYIEDAEYI
ncbi:MAG: response regulator transcription factor [Paludibacter sp.]|nr:response regulator transcription factor [Paludibacter sp.]